MDLIATARNAVRAVLLARESAADPRRQVWQTARLASQRGAFHKVCNICGWHGAEFDGPAHSERAVCPHCGSIARDRFLHWCWTSRVPYERTQRVLETSPRLDARYRRRMNQLVEYLASDYDESAHRASIKIDLQDIALPDASLDVVLTPHVLEHVPDTGRSLAELHRVLAPGGSAFIMVPMPQAVTAPPKGPEYHGDHTLVYWRFGWDLRDKIKSAGLDVECLVPKPLIDRLESGPLDTGCSGPDLDEVDLLSQADPAGLTAVATEREARRHGFLPDLHFIVWHATKPADASAA